jgi:hypothetical protein
MLLTSITQLSINKLSRSYCNLEDTPYPATQIEANEPMDDFFGAVVSARCY